MADLAPGLTAPNPDAPSPVSPGERIDSIDTLRGFAVLGILPMNIPWFALSGAVWTTPQAHGGFTGLDYAAWLTGHLVFDQKMMSIFSMLFGAGIVLFTGRAERAGRSPAALHYRRTLALLAIGLFHAYVIWFGDILVAYAMCALLLYPARRLRPRWLIPIGLAVFFVAAPLGRFFGDDLAASRDAAAAVWSDLEAAGGGPPSPDGADAIDALTLERDEFYATPESIEAERALHHGPPLDLLAAHAEENFWFQTFGMLFWGFWRIGGLMLIGMGLFKLGVFNAARSIRFYALLAAAGYAVGVPLVAWGVVDSQRHAFDPVYMFQTGLHYNYFGSLAVALGHVGAFLLLWKSGAAHGLMRLLAAAGRMAFTNYLAQSVICAAIFYGWGLAQWGEYSRSELLLIVLAIWAAQLAWSPWWLARYRFGPAEWLWRSLTYGRAQPMRRAAAAA